MKYQLHINKERDSLSFSLSAPGTGVVWTASYPSFVEDARTGDLIEDPTLIDMGVMKSTSDTDGLTNYLITQSVLQQGDSISLINKKQ
jgi:hypothetical protein